MSTILRISVFLLATFLCFNTFAQKPDRRKAEVIRIENAPKIDGVLDDEVWVENGFTFNDNFYQIAPDNGEKTKFKTAFTALYDDKSIYFGIKMFDDNPELIPTQLTPRDNFGGNSDVVGLVFDTYDKGQNAMGFFVSSAGVQTDVLFSQENEDGAWDAVWNSAISIVEDGWIIEIEIPYFALRFPNQDEQLWGFNLYRVSKRFQEEAAWNFINAEIDGWINQSGQLKGISNIEPPIRLSLMPYLSTIYKHDGASDLSNKSIAGGADLKYGINDSFTLDLTLIPDFSQVRSDNLVLNLSPFEVQFDENRPFFTEGTEMFSKGNLFYSRRVGQSFQSFDDSVLGVGEELVSSPVNAPLINASKLSGRTANGTGLGIFNAMTNRSYAIVRDSQGKEREVMVDPFTNFNVAVIDQNLKNNSNIGIINTNVSRAGSGRDANVTFASGRLRDKSNTWELTSGYGRSSVSTVDSETGNRDVSTGHKYNVSGGKVSGNFQFELEHRAQSDDWNIRDMGFMRAPNNFVNSAEVEYNIFKPVWIINNWNVNFEVNHRQLYEPRTYTGLRYELGMFTQFKNFWNMGVFTGLNAGDNFNYWEPRTEGRYFKTGSSQNFNVFVGTDDRKAFRISAFRGFWSRPEDGAKENWMGMFPRYRVNDKLTISGMINIQNSENTKGWVNFDDDDNIIFGARNVTEIDSELSIQYTFNPKMNLNLRVRNYWSRVEYSDYYNLEENGTLGATDYSGVDENDESMHNANFDAFNIDLFYTWQIAPGSFLSVGYKKATSIYENILQKSYFNNLEKTLDTPGQTTVSARLIYFLDYSTLFGKR